MEPVSYTHLCKGLYTNVNLKFLNVPSCLIYLMLMVYLKLAKFYSTYKKKVRYRMRELTKHFKIFLVEEITEGPGMNDLNFKQKKKYIRNIRCSFMKFWTSL